MLSNYLKIAFKVLLRRKFFTVISLFGICFTLTTVLVFTAIADHHLAALAPEVNLDRTLFLNRMFMRMESEGGTRETWGSPGYRFLDEYARGIPGVEKVSIYSRASRVSSFVEGRKIVSSVKYTDGAYWEILDFDFLEGGPFLERDEQNGSMVAVISEATRRQVFGDRPVLDETFEFDARAYRVVGVVGNVDMIREPAQADIWAPHATRKSQEFRHEYIGDYHAMLLAGSRGDFRRIKGEFGSRIESAVIPDQVVRIEGTPMTRLETLAFPSSPEEFSDPPVMTLLWQSVGSLLAFMFLPAINLVAINMSRIIERSSEIGVRKTFGASSADLVGQFVMENIFLCLAGGVLALGAAAGVMEIIESSGAVPYLDLHLNLRVFFYSVLLAVLFGVLSGFFPAWRMARLHPVQALRGGA